MILIFLIPAGLTYTFGKMVGDTRQGWAIFAACAVMFFGGVFVCYWAEQAGNPNFTKLGVAAQATAGQTGGNMEGKESRFGIAESALFATVTTDASCGAVNGMHDSFTPLGGLVPLFNIETGEVIFGGVGAGLYGMLIYAIVAVFIAGLMVGRTPEYLGKKIEQKEVKMAMLALIATAFCILVFAAASSVIPFASPTKDAKGQTVAHSYWNPPGPAIANINNTGPHGFSEILYAYSSGTGNNGSAFAGISANTPWYNLTLGIGDADRPLPVPDPAAGRCRQSGRKEKDPRDQRHIPDARAAVCRPAGRTVVIRGGADFFPRALAGSDRRTFPDAAGKIVFSAGISRLELRCPQLADSRCSSVRSHQDDSLLPSK